MSVGKKEAWRDIVEKNRLSPSPIFGENRPESGASCVRCSSDNIDRCSVDGDKVTRVVPTDRIHHFAKKGALFCLQCGTYQNDAGLIVYIST